MSTATCLIQGTDVRLLDDETRDREVKPSYPLRTSVEWAWSRFLQLESALEIIDCVLKPKAEIIYLEI
jgi:hypothetical protein